MIIRNEHELKQAIKSLVLLKKSLESLRRDVKNQKNLNIMSEGTIDEINNIERDVLEYLQEMSYGSGEPYERS